MRVRRVVTGHDSAGKAIVVADGEVVAIAKRPGFASAPIWSNERVPVDNSLSLAPVHTDVNSLLPEGTFFAIAEYQPAVTARPHRTESVDHVVVLSGEIHLELDDSEVHLRQGDVLVQRGTIHNWVNRSDKPCVLAVVLIGAVPSLAARMPTPAQG